MFNNVSLILAFLILGSHSFAGEGQLLARCQTSDLQQGKLVLTVVEKLGKPVGHIKGTLGGEPVNQNFDNTSVSPLAAVNADDALLIKIANKLNPSGVNPRQIAKVGGYEMTSSSGSGLVFQIRTYFNSQGKALGSIAYLGTYASGCSASVR